MVALIRLLLYIVHLRAEEGIIRAINVGVRGVFHTSCLSGSGFLIKITKAVQSQLFYSSFSTPVK